MMGCFRTLSFFALMAAVPAVGQVLPNEENLHDELRALKVTMQRAMNERDIDTLVAHVDEQVVFTTMNNDVVRGRDGIRAYFEKMMKGPDRVVERIESNFEADDLSIFHEDDIAIAFGRSQDYYELKDGRSFDVQARWSGTMLRKDGQWLIGNFHYSTNMFDNPVLLAQRQFLLFSAAGVSIVLLIIGLFIGWRVGKRSKD